MNSSIKSPFSPSSFHRWLLAAPLAIFFLPASASALVMRGEEGPEPIIVQIKESLRLSNDLDGSLSDLAQVEQEAGVSVVNWWAGSKLLQLVSFSNETTHEQALEIIKTLRKSSAVEKIVPVSGFNLEFKPGDFARAYTPNQEIPQAARRGLDVEEWLRAARPLCPIGESLNTPHVPNQIIVRWKSEHAWKADQTGFRQDITDFHGSAGTHVVHEMTPTPTDLIQVIELNDPETSLADKLKEYADSPWVDYAQPNYIYSRYTVTPNDPYYTSPGQLYLDRIQASAAWSITTGDHRWVVAVADGGANVLHPDFAPSPSPSPGHPGNLSLGWRNFYVNPPDNNVADTEYGTWHGSHVASIIGAIGNNGKFMTGVAWDVSLLILRTPTSSQHNVQAIDYAWSNEGHDPAIAINISWGLGPRSCLDSALVDAVGRARAHDMVIVAAAGNGDLATGYQGLNSDLSTNLITPASIPMDNVIAVGATRVRPDRPDLDHRKPNFSYFGKYRVELGAPGGDDAPDSETFGILGLTQFFPSSPISSSSAPSDPCDGSLTAPCTRLSGTSFSAPQVAGALALVKSQYPWENYAGIRDRVIMGTDDVDVLEGVYRSGRLNLQRALLPRTLIKNLSTRARVEGGDKVMIAGFVIGGSSEQCGAAPLPPCLTVAIRGLGPSVPVAAGIPRLVDPVIELYRPNHPVDPNDNWQDDPSAAALTTLGLQPSNTSEAAMIRSLPPGAYTVVVRSHGSPSDYGVGLVELYALGNDERFRLQNISTRCLVGTGDDVAIAGTILQPGVNQPNTPAIPPPKRRILSFGRGPSLQRFGLDGLPNPYLEFHQVIDNEDVIIAYNDQWKDIDGPSPSTGLQDKLVERGFMPAPKPGVEQYENESALWPTLRPDSYTAILKDTGNASGIGLIEFYEY